MSDEEDYADDFETYEDDFESEDDGPSIDTVQATRTEPSDEAVSQSLPGKAALGLSDAQRGHAAQQWARHQQISPQVKLQELVLDNLFDLPALTENDLFAMGRGPYRDATVGSCQTSSDAVARVSQTDHIETSCTACQCPETALSGADERVLPDESPADDTDADLLLPFLQSAGSLILGLLQSQHHNKAEPHFNADVLQQRQSLITGSLLLHDLKLLQGHTLTSMAFRETDNMVLAAYGPSQNKGQEQADMGYLCLWDLGTPAAPVALMASEGCPTACTLLTAPGRSNLILAGMQEGGLCLWDCMESSQHPDRFTVESKGHVGQRPTYTTECHGTFHTAGPVVAVVALPQSAAHTGDQSTLEPKKTRFLAITDWGNVSLWSVHVLTSSEDIAGVQADPGLQFGGRVRLLLLAANLPLGNSRGIQVSVICPHAQQLQAHAAVLALLPNKIDEFVVAGNNDQILRGSLYGQAAVPKKWQLNNPGAADRSSQNLSNRYLHQQVTCISFSPFLPDLMAAGHSGGVIAVYSLRSSSPLMVVQASANAICAIVWSPSRPSLVIALDSATCMVLLELTGQVCQPRVVSLASLLSSAKGTAVVTKLLVYKSASVQQAAPHQILVFGLDSGQIECCMLHQTLTKPQPEEQERMLRALKLPHA